MLKLITFFSVIIFIQGCKSFKPGYYCSYSVKTNSITGFNFADSSRFYSFIRSEGNRFRKINSGTWQVYNSKVFYVIDTTYTLNGVPQININKDTFYLRVPMINRKKLTANITENGMRYKAEYRFCNNNPSLSSK